MTRIKQAIQESIDVKQQILHDDALIATIEKAADTLYQALKNGHKVLFCGNGGSAADAQHLAAELSGRFYFDRDPLPAEAMHCNTSYITAVANDYGYDVVYSRMIKGSASEGDVVVGLSTSGNSVNIIKAFEVAKTKGVKSIALTGLTGGDMKNSADILINVPSKDTARIQESHITIGHILCELVETRLFGAK
ncbi:MAG: D-sedoheptulose 7-phosphate isomerase [Paludibacteraceae bacterium]|nr:D-sedoheptulose 7-phosphate isomerase [Paludibacteraceae bacterium]